MYPEKFSCHVLHFQCLFQHLSSWFKVRRKTILVLLLKQAVNSAIYYCTALLTFSNRITTGPQVVLCVENSENFLLFSTVLLVPFPIQSVLLAFLQLSPQQIQDFFWIHVECKLRLFTLSSNRTFVLHFEIRLLLP